MLNNLLEKINFPKDLRELNQSELPQIAKELRSFIINVISTEGGHLGASLGVVELTIALHYVFNTPNDKLVWDVGHQAYGHKILTGRKDRFHTNRKFNGISGFPKRSESEYDTFGVGHSSTSISAALGMAIASQLKGEDRHHIAVIGDASIASGMAFEALNHAGDTEANILIILNNNTIGIDPSVGALKNYLTSIKSNTETNQHNIFEALNFDYTGAIDGHNFDELVSTLNELKAKKGVKFLHVITTKGKGLKQAEVDQVTYHAPGKFDKVSGNILPKEKTQFTKYQDVFGQTLVELARLNEKIVAITPAMLTGSSLTYMKETFPNRTIDVGIAEQHAVTLSAGLASQGMIPFCNIYSTFMQRAYDQIIHDVAIQNLPVILCLDRAGLVGEDGATHHGVFDLAYLRCIPNMIVVAPRNEIELRNILYTAQCGLSNPIAIRYPRGYGSLSSWKKDFEQIEIGKGQCLQKGEETAILTVGNSALKVSEAIKISGKRIGHYDMRFVKPLDKDLLQNIFNSYKTIITVEDGTVVGGFGTAVSEYATMNNYSNQIKTLGVPDKFIEHGKVSELETICGTDIEAIINLINS